MKKTVIAVLIIGAFILFLNAPSCEARGGHHGWGWWAPWAIVGGAVVASSYYYAPPYYSYPYYPPPYYYPYYPPRAVVVAPPAYAMQQAPVQSYQPSVERHFVYPRQGQNEKQQADDQYSCHRWSVGQTGYDPTHPGSIAPQDQPRGNSDYWRAMSACLDAHGYTVR